MSDGFPNKPKILRGAFVEFGLSLPPLIVVFQFNPLQLTRNRALTFAANGTSTGGSIRDFHGKYKDLLDLRREQLRRQARAGCGCAHDGGLVLGGHGGWCVQGPGHTGDPDGQQADEGRHHPAPAHRPFTVVTSSAVVR